MLLRVPLLELLYQLHRDVDGGPELDYGARAEAVGVEVGETDRLDFDLQSGSVCHCAEGHDGYSGFQWEEVGAVVATTWGYVRGGFMHRYI